jgi:hypothetical protein
MGITLGIVRDRRRDETWTRQPVVLRDRFIVTADLGQSIDPTAIAVLHHHVVPLDTWTEIRGANGFNILRQDRDECFDVRHLARLPLGTAYPTVVQHVADLIARPPLRRGCDLLIDETGVGRAVGDIFEHAGMQPQRVTITAGNEATEHEERRWHVAKGILVSSLDARLSTGELRFAASLAESAALADELKDFRRHVGAAGRATYSARAGKHDDLVLAVAIATWWASKPSTGGENSWGTVSGLT